MTRPLFLGAAALALAGAPPAVALSIPKAGHADLRMRSVDYDPGQVVRLVAVPRVATQVAFSAGETIDHVALGDSAAWDIAAEHNLLFLKPKGAGAATDLIVTTSGPEGARSYVFELAPARGARAGRGGYYVLRFRYPGDEAQAAHTRLAQQAAGLEHRITQLKLDRGALEGPRNLAYVLQGPADLSPSEVSDNGRFTVMRFPGQQALPAIYAVTPAGQEALAQFDVRGDFVVVHGVLPALRLRRGREVVCITNQAWRAQGAATGTRTAARDVVRTDTGGRS